MKNSFIDRVKHHSSYYWGVLFVLIVSAVLMGRFLSTDHVLMATDPVVSSANRSFAETLQGYFGTWNPAPLLGSGYSASLPQVSVIMRGLMHPIAWNNLSYILGVVIGGMFLFSFVYRKTKRFVPSLLSALVVSFFGGNFSIIYAGHGFKPYVVLFFILSLLCAGFSGWAGGVIWGAVVGLMFIQQPDVAMFFAIFAGFYLLFRLWQRDGKNFVAWLKVLVPAAVVAFLLASGPLLSGYKNHVKGVSVVEDPASKWEYITQWSFPPDDVGALIAPGYKGWRTGEAESPYWGRTGRSEGWEETRQGFMNFKLDDTYLGIIPFMFALYALCFGRKSERRAEIWFWGGTALLAFLLALGKYFPLYHGFFELPVVGNIRAPVKFMLVFQVAIAILCGYGVNLAFFKKNGAESRKDLLIFAVPSLLLVFAFIVLGVTQSGQIADFVAQGWQNEAANVIVVNKIKAIGHAVVLSIICLVALLLSRFDGKAKFVGAGLLILTISGDVWLFSRQFVKEMPRSFIAENPLTDFLKKDLGEQRVAMVSQQGIYNVMVTYLLPYNRIPTFNFDQMPRMPHDYEQLLKAGSKNPLGMWSFAAVKYLLAPTQLESQLTSAGAKRVFTYNVAGVEGGGYSVIPDEKGTFAVFELANPRDRYQLFGKSVKADDATTLSHLMAPAVRISPESDLPILNGSEQGGTVEVISYLPGKVRLKTTTSAPAILRCADRFDADWKAKIDGQNVKIQRVDFLCQGLAIPVGVHTIDLKYAPSRLFLYLQSLGFVIAFIAIFFVIRERKNA